MENRNRMNKCWLSIIVPVYNTPIEHMKRMFHSLTHQTAGEYKIIIIDDGSNQSCLAYLSLLNRQYTYVELYTINHLGVSSARNFGLSKVKTPYVAFADADDEYSTQFVEEGRKIIDQYKPDIVFGVMKFKPEKSLVQSKGVIDVFSTPSEIEEIKKAFLGITPRALNYSVLGTPCARFYRTSIARRCQFRTELHYYEDQIFNRECINNAKRVLVVPNEWYTYYQNNFSAMHAARRVDFYNETKNYWDVYYEMNQKEPDEYKVSLRTEQLNFWHYVLDNDFVRCKIPPKRNSEKINRVINHPMIQDSLRNLHPFSDSLKLRDRVNVILIKHHMYILLYIKKRIAISLGLFKDY